MISRNWKVRTLGALALFAGCTGAALAVPLTLSYSTTNNGTSDVTVGSGFTNGPGVPSSSTFANSFLGPTLALNGAPSYGFYDDFIFTVTGSTVNSISTTIDLGTLQISNFQERLYNAAGNTIPTFGTPVGGAIDAWTSPIGTSGTVAVLPATNLTAGTYVLEIRGNVTGANGGSYAGTLNIVPIPLPAAAWLLGSGLLGLGTMARRRKRPA